MEDAEIVALFWSRDDGAIPAAQARYGGRLLRLAEQLLHSPQDAEECVNDTWLRAWRAIPPERPENLFAYLVRVCRNLALDRLDRRSARKRAGEVLTGELETCLPGLFAIGDGAGITRGLAQAGASGVKVAQVIAQRLT